MGLTAMTGCGKYDNMPTFTFDFHVKPGDSPVSLELAPIDYILKFQMAGKDDCVVGISPDADVIWTLGQVFLRSFYSVFDRDENRIGFARLPRKDFHAINSKSTMKVVKERQKQEVKKSRAMTKGKSMSFREKMAVKEAKRLARLDKAHVQKSHIHRDSLLQEAGLVRNYDGLRHVRYERV